MKTVIIYESWHHGNTKKLVDAIAAAHGEVRIVGVDQADSIDLQAYDLIGLAAGIDHTKFYAKTEAMARKLPEGKRVFLIYTCGMMMDMYTRSMEAAIRARHCTLVGAYGCLGFDTYGPLEKRGGIAKGHPDEREIAAAVEFYERLADKAG